MYEGLYEPVPDTGKVLERIGLAGLEVKHDLRTLDMLIDGFITHIPFENLTVAYEHKVPSLAIRDLYDKIILKKRGGYCHELNGLFYAFLKSLGFDVYCLAVFVRENVDGLPTLGHRSTMCIIDGRKYFADVGFGKTMAGFAVPVDGTLRGDFFIRYEDGEYTLFKTVDPEKENASGNGRFVTGQILISGSKETGSGKDALWSVLDERTGAASGPGICRKEVYAKKIQMFRDYKAYPVEFVLPNAAVSLDADEPFNKNIIINFRNPEGETFTIVNDSFRAKTKEGPVNIKIENDRQFLDILREYLNIEL